MYGKIEAWRDAKNAGFVCVEVDLGKGQRRLDRYFLGGRQIILLAVPGIQSGCWVRFNPGRAPKPGLLPLALEVEVWGSPVLAWEADHRSDSSQGNSVQKGIKTLIASSNEGGR